MGVFPQTCSYETQAVVIFVTLEKGLEVSLGVSPHPAAGRRYLELPASPPCSKGEYYQHPNGKWQESLLLVF